MDASDDQTPKKKSGKILTIAALAAITLLGAGGGWVVGGLLATPPVTAEEARLIEEAKAAIKAKKEHGKPAGAEGHGGGKKKDEEGLPTISAALGGILQLDPITTNLAYPAENWVRLEVALLFKGASDPAMAKTIQEDITTYLKTVSLQQIQGPRGFQYLRDDIKERVDLRSQGQISDVIFRTFVIQ